MKVLFSSWQGQVVDNRGKPEDQWADAANVKLPDSFDGARQFTAFMGWSGIIALKEPFDAVELAANYAKSLQQSSCAQCFPCRVGTKVIEDIFTNILAGKATAGDIDQVSSLCDEISSTSKCGIGQLGTEPFRHLIQHFRPELEAYIAGRKKPAGYAYPYKMTAPCTSACPTQMDIPKYIEQIKDGDFAGSLATIRQASPMASSLGRACFHPCERNCRRSNVDQPIAICKLKRFAWDYEDLHAVKKPQNPNMHTAKKKIAVIGGGPSGVSCAYYLALKGYSVTIFEKLPENGGAIYTGIPEYRVPNGILKREIDYVRELGVEILNGVEFGKDETFKTLRDKGFTAFYCATGADLSKKMYAEGEDSGFAGFEPGVFVLKDMKLGTRDIPPVKNVLVVGGGNTAMDCVRSSVRIGCENVYIVYRRTEKELPADPHEVHEAKDEGVQFKFLLAPTKIVAENGKVVGLECQKMELGEPDASGRRKPEPKAGTEHVIPADRIIPAIGQDCNINYIKEDERLQQTKWKTIISNDDTLQTHVPEIFAGGDVQLGPLTLVDAVGQARRAAVSIDQYLSGAEVSRPDEYYVEKIIRKLGAYDKAEKVDNVKGWDRKKMRVIEHEFKVKTFKEVELGYSIEEALEEAARCMRCYIVGTVCVPEQAQSGSGRAPVAAG